MPVQLAREDATQPPFGRRVQIAVVLILFAVAAAVRMAGVTRPVIQTGIWHEVDLAAIARNFDREGMNLFYPRIDWRGDGPGYAEMEFPALSWTMAVFYRVFGAHELIGRILSFIVSLGTLLVFFRLAFYFLPAVPALAAWTFFAFHPLIVEHATSIQPEGPMLLFYLLSVYLFVRWLDTGAWSAYLGAVVSTSLAILAKAPAAHIGLFFAVLVLNERGIRALTDLRIWCFAMASLLPGILWYSHAHQLYLIYGNSLGVSNEYHWAGWDLLANAYFVQGILRHELSIWTLTGLVVAIPGIALEPSRRIVKYGLYWLFAVFVFYLMTARTTADGWARHYHIVSVLPAALLIGAGVDTIRRVQLSRPLLWISVLALGVVAASGAVLGAGELAGEKSKIVLDLALRTGIGAALLIGVAMTCDQAPRNALWSRMSLVGGTLLACVVAGGLASTYVSEGKGLLWTLQHQRVPDRLYLCATEMAPQLKRDGLIVASGMTGVDRAGHQNANNPPYMFYWLDRKGFNMSCETQSLETLKGFVERGAEYFVAEKTAVASRPGFERELRSRFSLRHDCGEAMLFDLRIAP